MKIIIAGAGDVGTHLAKLLSREEQDIVLIDENAEKLRSMESFNIMTYCGKPTSIEALKGAGVKGADLFIAVTPEESQNLNACFIASHLGAKKTLARIENSEYMLPRNKELFEQMGVDSLIYPEMLAAREIVSYLKKTWVRQWWEAGDGALLLVGVKIRANATKLIDIPLLELTKGRPPYHVVAIKRGRNTILPRGNDCIMAGDVVYFTLTREYVNELMHLCGKEAINVKRIMIMGGSRIAILTTNYLDDKMSVKLIESNVEKARKLVEATDNVLVIHGDGRNLELLKEEGIENVDAFVALTGSSESNILACMTAKHFGIHKTVAEVENFDYIPMAEDLDIGTVVNKKILAASHIYKLLLESKVLNIKCLTYADAELAEMVAKPGSKITKSKVRDLRLPNEIVLGGLIRDDKGIIITGDTQVQEGDTVIVFFLGTAISKVEKIFN